MSHRKLIYSIPILEQFEQMQTAEALFLIRCRSNYPAADQNTSPLSNFESNGKRGTSLYTYSPDGDALTFNAVNTVTVDDTNRYNLKSVNSARLTLEMISEWTESVNSQRAQLGANLQRLNIEGDNNKAKIIVREYAHSRIADIDFAEESTNFASNKIRVQASIAVLSQAKNLSIGFQFMGAISIRKK